MQSLHLKKKKKKIANKTLKANFDVMKENKQSGREANSVFSDLEQVA